MRVLRLLLLIGVISSAVAFATTIDEELSAHTIVFSNIPIFSIDKNPVERMRVTGQFHQALFTAREGSTSVVYKFLKFPKVSPQSGLGDNEFSPESGVSLGAMFGGPRLLGWGAVTFQDQHSYNYIKLEHLFPGENAFNAKENWFHKLKFSERSRVLREMAASLWQIVQAHIVTVDLDVFYTFNGRWRWIDTDFWVEGTFSNAVEAQFTRMQEWISLAQYEQLKRYYLALIPEDDPRRTLVQDAIAKVKYKGRGNLQIANQCLKLLVPSQPVDNTFEVYRRSPLR